MFSQIFYPIICTENYVKTVNFYEDHFEFIPEFELSGFTILNHKHNENMYLAIMDRTHDAIPEQYKKTVSGMILNYPVKDVNAAYQQYYWEGLNIVSEPAVAPCARKHFFIEDPNGILIDIAQHVEMKNITCLDENTRNLATSAA